MHLQLWARWPQETGNRFSKILHTVIPGDQISIPTALGIWSATFEFIFHGEDIFLQSTSYTDFATHCSINIIWFVLFQCSTFWCAVGCWYPQHIQILIKADCTISSVQVSAWVLICSKMQGPDCSSGGEKCEPERCLPQQIFALHSELLFTLQM